MLMVDVADFTKNAANVLGTALTDQVIVNGGNGTRYKLEPIKEYAPPAKGKSPFDGIKRVPLGLTMAEIIECIKEGRDSRGGCGRGAGVGGAVSR